MSTSDGFDVSAAGYNSLIGRYLHSLAPAFAEAAGVAEGAEMQVLDVGCGPGGLTIELCRRVGQSHVSAIDPSAAFVQACQEQLPDADIRVGVAEQLPFEDDRFDATLSSLVVGFLADPLHAAREMLRVTKRDGIVAACFWDLSHMQLLGAFWSAAAQFDPAASAMRRFGSHDGEIADLLSSAGAHDVTRGILQADADYLSFDELWSPFEEGIGPVGQYYRQLTDEQRATVRDSVCETLGVGDQPFTLNSRAWFACGKVPAL